MDTINATIGQWADKYNWSTIPELCDHDYPRDQGGVFKDKEGTLRCSWCGTPIDKKESE
jgi:hypothetical protein